LGPDDPQAVSASAATSAIAPPRARRVNDWWEKIIFVLIISVRGFADFGTGHWLREGLTPLGEVQN